MVLLKLCLYNSISRNNSSLHSTMVLLKLVNLLLFYFSPVTLHSTMVLLKPENSAEWTANKTPLHSTMVLLKLSSPFYFCRRYSNFTFHYGLIKTVRRHSAKYSIRTLHSTMVLLKLIISWNIIFTKNLYIPLWSY